jgi:hypothetical protein
MFRTERTPDVVDHLSEEPIALSPLALDLEPPVEGWTAYLHGRISRSFSMTSAVRTNRP